jgi:hypothetical protein
MRMMRSIRIDLSGRSRKSPAFFFGLRAQVLFPKKICRCFKILGRPATRGNFSTCARAATRACRTPTGLSLSQQRVCSFVTILIYTFSASGGSCCGWQRFGEIFPTNIMDARILVLAHPLRLNARQARRTARKTNERTARRMAAFSSLECAGIFTMITRQFKTIVVSRGRILPRAKLGWSWPAR